MDALSRLNSEVARVLGWSENGEGWKRTASDGTLDTALQLPDFVDNLSAMWQTVEYAAKHRVEYSLFMLMYDRQPIFMASFIQGMNQRTSTDNDPKLATCRAFLMMFSRDATTNGEPSRNWPAE